MFSSYRRLLRSNRNFRLLWGGLLLSFSGSLMQNAALLWHVSLLVGPDDKAMAPAQTRPLRILLAEDSPFNQKLAQGVLGKRGHQLTIANNASLNVTAATTFN